MGTVSTGKFVLDISTIIFLIYLGIINLVTFILRGIDKYKATANKWRIKEKHLLILTAIGGFVGALIGMSFFHHKTIKSKFLIGFWGISFVRIIVLILFLFLFF